MPQETACDTVFGDHHLQRSFSETLDGQGGFLQQFSHLGKSQLRRKGHARSAAVLPVQDALAVENIEAVVDIERDPSFCDHFDETIVGSEETIGLQFAPARQSTAEIRELPFADDAARGDDESLSPLADPAGNGLIILIRQKGQAVAVTAHDESIGTRRESILCFFKRIHMDGNAAGMAQGMVHRLFEPFTAPFHGMADRPEITETLRLESIHGLAAGFVQLTHRHHDTLIQIQDELPHTEFRRAQTVHLFAHCRFVQCMFASFLNDEIRLSFTRMAVTVHRHDGQG